MKNQKLVIWYPFIKSLAFYNEEGKATTVFHGSVAEEKMHRLPKGTEVTISIDQKVSFSF